MAKDLCGWGSVGCFGLFVAWCFLGKLVLFLNFRKNVWVVCPDAHTPHRPKILPHTPTRYPPTTRRLTLRLCNDTSGSLLRVGGSVAAFVICQVFFDAGFLYPVPEFIFFQYVVFSLQGLMKMILLS